MTPELNDDTTKKTVISKNDVIRFKSNLLDIIIKHKDYLSESFIKEISHVIGCGFINNFFADVPTPTKPLSEAVISDSDIEKMSNLFCAVVKDKWKTDEQRKSLKLAYFKGADYARLTFTNYVSSLRERLEKAEGEREHYEALYKQGVVIINALQEQEEVIEKERDKLRTLIISVKIFVEDGADRKKIVELIEEELTKP